MASRRTMQIACKCAVAAAALFVAACGADAKPPVAPVAPAAPAASASGDAAVPGPIEGAPSSGLSGAAKAKYEAGFAAWWKGDLLAAKTSFSEAQALDAKAPAPSHALGVVLERLGDVSGALSAYRSAFSTSPAHEVSVCSYALLLASTGKSSEADAFLTDKRNQRKNSPQLTACNAEVKSMASDHATAQQLAQDALRMDPDYKDAMVAIARDHYRARRLDLAKYALQAILEGFGESSPPRDKENAEAHLLRGLVFREGGARAVALTDFESAVKRRPDLVEALLNLGSMRLEAGNASEAVGVLESATRFAPTLALAHVNLGDAYRLLGRYAEAKREFETALARDSSLAAAHYNMGLMYLTAPSIPGQSADAQVSSAIKELETYRKMRGPKAPYGVQDDIDDLLARAKAKQAELKQAPAPQAAPAGDAATGKK